MGWGQSKEVTETKVADSTGTINNNIIIRDPVEIQNHLIVALLAIICGIKILELGLYIYREHKKTLKKKYINNPS